MTHGFSCFWCKSKQLIVQYCIIYSTFYLCFYLVDSESSLTLHKSVYENYFLSPHTRQSEAVAAKPPSNECRKSDFHRLMEDRVISSFKGSIDSLQGKF